MSDKADEEAPAVKLELAILQAPYVIVSGDHTLEQCIEWICAYFPAGDRKIVAARITAGVDKLKAKIDAPAVAVEFPPYWIDFGWPVLVDHPGRGPKPKKPKTQYDATLKQRKGSYQKLVRLPKLRFGAGDQLQQQLKTIAESMIPARSQRRLCEDIVEHLANNPDLLQCSESTVKRFIRKQPYRYLSRQRFLKK